MHRVTKEVKVIFMMLACVPIYSENGKTSLCGSGTMTSSFFISWTDQKFNCILRFHMPKQYDYEAHYSARLWITSDHLGFFNMCT